MSVFSNPASGAAEQATAYVNAVLELLGDRDPMEVLRDMPAAIARAIDGLSLSQLRQREEPGKWSINEILQHLADSEVVAAWRMRVVMAEDRPTITGYDQDLWAQRLHYDEEDPHEAVERFRLLRRGMLRLLERATAADFARAGVHAERGEESLGLMLKLYAGHDLLHLRQIARVRGVVAPS